MRHVEYPVPDTGQAYIVAVLENHSRTVLASAVTLVQDTNAYLSVFHAAVGRCGSPGTIVTDGRPANPRRPETIPRSRPR